MFSCSIDPGVHSAAVAVFEVTSCTLVDAFYIETDGTQTDLGAMIHFELSKYKPLFMGVVEKPMVYQTAHQKGDQKDITNLTLAAGALGMALAILGAEVVFVYPHQWKGQAPKHVSQQRVDAVLRPEEKAAIQWPSKAKAHNVWDAVHLGLRTLTKRKC